MPHVDGQDLEVFGDGDHYLERLPDAQVSPPCLSRRGKRGVNIMDDLLVWGVGVMFAAGDAKLVMR